ncbi:MAG: hypothetical protein R3F11_20830 [Verrucomicrobiales bacterium]
MDRAFNVVGFVFEATSENAFDLGAKARFAELVGEAVDVPLGHLAQFGLTEGNHGVGFQAALG